MNLMTGLQFKKWLFRTLLLGSLLMVKLTAANEGDIPAGLGISADGKSAVAIGNDSMPSKLVVNNQADAPIDETAVERIMWDKVPLAISLGVGQERMVTFPGSVRVGIPSHLSATLRTLSQAGTVYWLANAPFAATRIQLEDKQTGQYYLVDLSATEHQKNNARLEIYSAATDLASASGAPAIPELLTVNPDSGAALATPNAPVRKKTATASDYVLLTRYAAQQLYAPARVLKTLQGIQAAPFDHTAGNSLIRGGGNIEAEPVAAWRKGALYVTAVKLSNRSAQPITLDPRLIRGQWRTATFQHATLGPNFRDDNVTALYLISDRPFAEVR